MSDNKALPTKEIRSRKSDAQVRASETGKRTIDGHAATFGDWYEIGDVKRWGFMERIAPGAFADVLDNDVLALVNHNADAVPLGRTISGTLRLSVDGKGLRYEIDPPASASREIEAVERGDMPFSSFAFEVAEDEWEFGTDGQPDKRTITKIRRLWDVSIVSHPANPNAEVAVRSRDQHRAQPPELAMRERKLRLLQLMRRREEWD